MGMVKIDIHRAEREFEQLTMSDENVVKWLIMYRDKVNPYHGADHDNCFDNAGNVKSLNQELICLYVWLDEIIEKCNFDDRQRKLIELLQNGYTFKDISDLEGFVDSDARKMFKRICKSIVKENERQWKIYAHWEYRDTIFKVCNTCDESLPRTNNFFGKNKTTKDGFANICKKCDSSRKNKDK